MPGPYSRTAFAVNPAALESCGQTARHLGGQIPPETTKITAPSDQAAAALRGWLTGPAVHDCAADWKTLLDRLAADMGNSGTKLSTAAADYRRNEQDLSTALNGGPATTPCGYRAPAADPFGTVLTKDLSPAAEAARTNGTGKAP
ncbi:hypothetical protein [Kitasatospora sp. NPDC097691]|uniref:WXG100 family type VII secretion target n=1 Tax=Kitasatospora sp. NPDC097691 TaxID=3157231 RepID=UPI0033202866